MAYRFRAELSGDEGKIDAFPIHVLRVVDRLHDLEIHTRASVPALKLPELVRKQKSLTVELSLMDGKTPDPVETYKHEVKLLDIVTTYDYGAIEPLPVVYKLQKINTESEESV